MCRINCDVDHSCSWHSNGNFIVISWKSHLQLEFLFQRNHNGITPMKIFSAFLAVFFMVLLCIFFLFSSKMDLSLYAIFGCLTAAAVYQFAVLDSIYKLFKDEIKQKVFYNALSVITISPEFESGKV
jgi:hypothetical protein